MLRVKSMSAGDFQFATKLANTMDWKMANEDFEFMLSLEPEGCFVAFQGSTRVGIATCISFGKVGWFGNLIVKQKHRKKGVGSLLVRHAVSYLQSRGVQTIGLYAYPHLTGFYGNLGFKSEKDFSVLHVETLDSFAAETLSRAGRRQIQAIEQFDSCCFGGNRKRLLESIILGKSNLCYYKSEGNKVEGYVAATVYEKTAWIGPLICREGKVDVAVSLLKAVLGKLTGKSVYAVLPKKETALSDMLSSAGFRKDFSVSRMFLGQPVAKNCIYIAESLERG